MKLSPRFLRTTMMLGFALLGPCASLPAQKGHADYPNASPFEMVRFEGQTPEVRVDGKWYGLVAIGKVETKDLLAFAKKRCGDRWAKRFCEDLVFLLSEMGHPPGKAVDLSLKDLKTGKKTIEKNVAMTHENRRAIHAAEPRPGGRAANARAQRVPAARAAPAVREASPFQAIRFTGYAPQVRVDGTWYGLLEIDGVSTRDILRFCSRTYGDRSFERFCEDLVRVRIDMGKPPAATVSLLVKDLKSGLAKRLDQVPMSRANRAAIKRVEPFEDLEPRRAERDKRRPDMERFGFVPNRMFGVGGRVLTVEQAEQDLDRLEWLIDNTYSYATLRKPDYRGALDTIRQNLGTGIRVEDFHIQLRMVVALFGDGHARVRGVYRHLGSRFPQCTFAVHGDEVVAIDPGTGGFVSPGHPIVEQIAGQPIAKLLGLASRIEAKGSRQFVHRGATTNLMFLDFWQTSQGWGPAQKFELTLRSVDSTDRVKTEIAMDRRAHPYRGLRKGPPVQTLEGNIGYLRIESMDSSRRFLDGLRHAMEQFRSTKGLILDVRGNGGGSRFALRKLFPYLMNTTDAPHVANIGTYRLTPDDAIQYAEGYLANRFLYPKTAGVWDAADLRAINAATRKFKPKWTPRGGDFSALHYMLLKRREGDGAYHYDKPVIVLIDSGCFSATDIFVGAFQGWRNVTIMGTPTGGGSGRSQTSVLEHSGLEVKLSTMVSYRPDGSMYDGVGITPDVVAEPTLDDILGRTDSVLEKARTQLAK